MVVSCPQCGPGRVDAAEGRAGAAGGRVMGRGRWVCFSGEVVGDPGLPR